MTARDKVIAELARRRGEDPLVRMSFRRWVNMGPARRRRKELGLTIHELATRGDLISPKTISNVETGKAGMRVTVQSLYSYALLAGLPVLGFLMDYAKWQFADPRLQEITPSIKKGLYESVRMVRR